MPYEDGLKTIFLYTRGEKNIPSQKLADMLKYIDNSTEENIVNEDIKDVSKMLDSIKSDSERGIRYMKSWEIEDCAYRKGKAEMQIVVNEQKKQLAEKDEKLAEKDKEIERLKALINQK